jgi:predicted DNA-binding transcriptional regulator AlpA
MRIMSEKHLDASQLAERWGKPISWVYSNWKRLRVPAIRVGQAIRFPLKDIVQWEERNRA